MTTRILVAAAIAAALSSTQASAAVFSSYSGSASLSVVGFNGDINGLEVTTLDPILTVGAPTIFGDADAGSDAPDGVFGDDGAAASISGFASAFGGGFGSGFSGSFAGVAGYIDNLGLEPVTLELRLDYDLFATVDSDGSDGDFGDADVLLSLLISGLDAFTVSAESEIGLGEVRAQGFQLFTIVLDGDAFGPQIDLSIEGFADASAVSAVPLPAGLPLLAAGLGALALLRRRAA